MEYTIKLTPTLLQDLIDHQAELDYDHLIYETIKNNDIAMFTMLIHRITNNINELFSEAVHHHNLTMCTILIDKGADPTSIPILYSLISSDYTTEQTLELINLLLNYHFNLNELLYNGKPILHMVRNVEIFKLLLNRGADWKLRDNKGMTVKEYLTRKLTKEQMLQDEHAFYKMRYCDNKIELFEEFLDILAIYETMVITKKSSPSSTE